MATRGLIAFSAVLNLACSAPVPERSGCDGIVAEPLMHGSSEEVYLGLTPSELSAIVRVVSPLGPELGLCTGTLISDEWVLTAGHCLIIESAEVALKSPLGAELRLPVASALRHPELDAGLLHVPGSIPEREGVTPIVPAASAVELVPADAVELAGYGVTEDGTVAELRFLVEPIVSVDDQSLVVTGSGASGACAGDSGGPLLVRDQSGRVAVAGVLSGGSTSCLAHDRYVRVASVASWLDQASGSSPAAPAACGGMDEAGRCLYGRAMRCAEGKLVSEACDAGTHCGWDRTAAGFRCVTPSNDPCRGVDEFGACNGNAALVCNGGRLHEQRCACGDVCRIDGRSGLPLCRAP